MDTGRQMVCFCNNLFTSAEYYAAINGIGIICMSGMATLDLYNNETTDILNQLVTGGELF